MNLAHVRYDPITLAVVINIRKLRARKRSGGVVASVCYATSGSDITDMSPEEKIAVEIPYGYTQRDQNRSNVS